MFTHALVRPPGDSYNKAISSEGLNYKINVKKAKLQHQKYCEALEKIGLKLINLSPEEKYPDSCFVQDTCVILGDSALMTILGADSRKGEGEKVKSVIEKYKTIKSMKEPGTLDGGDVLVTPSKIFIGLSTRTNKSGIEQYRKLLVGSSLPEVISVPVNDCLHLMTGATYLGDNTVLISSRIDKNYFKGFNVIKVKDHEIYAANCVVIGKKVIAPAGFPETIFKLKKLGLEVIEVDVSEFEKADGGVTCLSVLF